MKSRSIIKVIAITFCAAIVILVVTLGWHPIVAATRKIVRGVVTRTSLVGYWSFDDCDSCTTAKDYAGSVAPGDLTGGAVRTSSGHPSNAIDLNGSTGYVNIPDSAAWDFGSGNFTISLFVQFDTVATPYNIFIAHDNGSGAQNKWLFSSDTTTLSFLVFPGGWITGPTDFNPVTGRWYHLAFVRSGSNNNFYIDGDLRATVVDSNAIPDISAALTIGQGEGLGYVDGREDEVRIYNAALSEQDIKKLYQQGRSKLVIKPASKTGLISFWNFDDCDTCATLIDRSGNGNNATTYNAAGPTAGDIHTASGKIGNGGTFNGSTNYASAPDTASYSFSGNVTTLEAWINASGVGDRVILSQYNGGVEGGILYYVSGNKLVYHDGAAGTITSNATIVNGNWYHVVYVSSSSTSHQIYINGVLDLDSSASAVVADSSQAMQIGSKLSSGSPSGLFNGQIDEVKIYNRALTAAEVFTDYQSTRRNFINVNQNNRFNDGLVGFWSFNGKDVSGVTATDRSGSGNNGTLTSGPTTVPGIVGQALKFDGINDKVTAGSTGLTGDLTASWSVWIKTNSVTSNDYQGIVSIGDTGVALNEFSLFLNYAGSGVVSLEYAGGNNCATAAGTIAANTWYHIVGTKTAGAINTTSTIYVNGAAVACTGSASTPSVAAGGTTFGDFGSAGYPFDGLMDEVRLYNRALSAAEVAEIYKASRRE